MGKDQTAKRVRWYRRFFAGFFLMMVGCTIASRIYDSITVPKVTTAWTKEKAVETVLTGVGTVKERELSFCHIESGLRVGSVVAAPGKLVEEGDPLFYYDLDSLKEQRERLQGELEKLQLDLQKETVSGEDYHPVTEGELASWELMTAERELLEGQQEYEKKQQEQQEECKRLEEDYERKRRLARDELWEQQEQQEEAASQELDSARNSRNSSLREARGKIQELEEELEDLKAEDAGEKELAKKEREIAHAKEDLEELQEDWENRIDNAETQLDWIDSRNERIRSGETSSQLALLEAYENAVRQQEKLLEEEAKKVEDLQKGVERAQWNLENARRQDESEACKKEQQKQLSRLVQQGISMDIAAKKQELEKLAMLIDTNGQVCADRKGTVAEVELLTGKTTTGEERLTIAYGSFWFEGEFEKEDQMLAGGDQIQIGIPGSSQKIDAQITEMNLLEEDIGLFRAVLTGEELSLGTRTGYECRKQSEKFQKVIPLQGLRKDMKGYYCLVAQTKKAILGEEFVARRVDVQLLYQGNTEAAVEGAIQNSDQVLVRSNQMIGEGDRVRLVDGF